MSKFPDHYRTFDNLDDALRSFGMPVANVPMAREVMAELHVETYYIISGSETYIGVEGHRGPPNLGYINRGHIDLRGDDRVWTRHVLPDNTLGGRSGGGKASRPDTVPDICPECSYALPVSGVCGNCD